MPAKSQAQRAYLNWRFGHAWTKKHEFDNKGELPAHTPAGRRSRMIREFTRKHVMAKPAAKPKSHPLQDKIAAGDRQAIKRALKDPNLRKYVKDPAVVAKYAPKVAQQRALNTRLDTAVVPGSSMTERDLARSANLQAQVKYQPAEAELRTQTAQAQQQAKDVGGPGGFYDQYLARLAQNQTDINNIQQGVVTGLQGVGQGITGLAASSLQSLQSAANADAASRGETAGNLTKTASDAAATRQALLGSFQAQQQLVGGTQKAYASGLTNVVGPTQKLAAQAQEAGRVRKLREKGLELATEKGTFTQQTREAGRADEAKNVLAKEIATGKSAVDLARITSQEKQTTARLTSQEQQTKDRLEGQAKQGSLNRQNQRELARLRAKDKAAKAKTGKGPDWVTSGQQGAALTQLTGLKSAATKAKTGQLFEPPKGGQKTPGATLDRHAAAQKILGYGPIAAKLKDPILVTAALDAVYDGHLSAATVKKLISAGYKPSRVASTLGVPTAANYKPTKPSGLGKAPTSRLKKT